MFFCLFYQFGLSLEADSIKWFFFQSRLFWAVVISAHLTTDVLGVDRTRNLSNVSSIP